MARRPASDSSPPDCRLTQARRIAADSCPLAAVGGESQLATSSVHAAVRGSPTPPFAGDHAAVRGESQPTVAAPSSSRGRPTRRPRSLARRRLWLPSARRPPPLSGQASGYGLARRPWPYLTRL